MEVEFEENGNYKLKVLLIGEAGVGKTNLINIMQGKDFSLNEITTSNCSFFMKEMTIDNLNFNVYLWDTIGQEKLRAQTKIFFKNSRIVILVYDITGRESFEKLESWHKLVKEALGDNIVLGVLGNKKDLFMQEQVKEEEAEEYAKSIGAIWALTSAKTERESFVTYVEDLIKEYIKKANIKKDKDDKTKDKDLIIREPSVKINNKETTKKKKKKIC